MLAHQIKDLQHKPFEFFASLSQDGIQFQYQKEWQAQGRWLNFEGQQVKPYFCSMGLQHWYDLEYISNTGYALLRTDMERLTYSINNLSGKKPPGTLREPDALYDTPL